VADTLSLAARRCERCKTTAVVPCVISLRLACHLPCPASSRATRGQICDPPRPRPCTQPGVCVECLRCRVPRAVRCAARSTPDWSTSVTVQPPPSSTDDAAAGHKMTQASYNNNNSLEPRPPATTATAAAAACAGCAAATAGGASTAACAAAATSSSAAAGRPTACAVRVAASAPARAAVCLGDASQRALNVGTASAPCRLRIGVGGGVGWCQMVCQSFVADTCHSGVKGDAPFGIPRTQRGSTYAAPPSHAVPWLWLYCGAGVRVDCSWNRYRGVSRWCWQGWLTDRTRAGRGAAAVLEQTNHNEQSGRSCAVSILRR